MEISTKSKLDELTARRHSATLLSPTQDTTAKLYRDIQAGDVNVLLAGINVAPTSDMGILSENPLRNQKYHLVIFVAMITHFCIEGGLSKETAYTMSRLFIQAIDKAENPETLVKIKRDVMNNYTLTMKNLSHPSDLSAHTLRAMEYIDNHLASSINNQMVAEAIEVNADYLSRLFKKELGVTLSQYITQKKCDMAKYILENSNISCKDISAYLGFASCSHFIVRFKKTVGQTPEEYRKQNYNKNFSY